MRDAVEEFDFSFEEFLTAYKVVTSRVYSVALEYHAAMVPVGDLFNHETSINAQYNFEKDDGFYITAYRDIQKGE